MPAPPITIGELTDVPTFNSPIASPWAQETARRIVHRFGSIAERDAKYPASIAGAGAMCAVAATSLYMSDATGWITIIEPQRKLTGGSPTVRWNNDPALPQIFPSALPSSAIINALFTRRGGHCAFAITVNSGSAGGLGSWQFNVPFVMDDVYGHDPFKVAYQAPNTQIYPGDAYRVSANLYGLATMVSGAAGTPLGALAPAGSSPPFAAAPNSLVYISGGYVMASPY